MKMTRFWWFALLAGQALFLSGCATSTLWETDVFSHLHQPANPLNLRVFYSERTRGLLIVYDERRETGKSVRTRAYWLSQHLEENRKPRFISAKEARGLTPV